MVYYISFDGVLWNVCDRKFRRDPEAIQYVQQLEGCEGRIMRISKDRIEVHFDGRSRFALLAE